MGLCPFYGIKNLEEVTYISCFVLAHVEFYWLSKKEIKTCKHVRFTELFIDLNLCSTLLALQCQ